VCPPVLQQGSGESKGGILSFGLTTALKKDIPKRKNPANAFRGVQADINPGVRSDYLSAS